MGREVLRWLFIGSVLGWLPMLGLMYYLWRRRSGQIAASLEARLAAQGTRLDELQKTVDDTTARLKRIEASTSKWEGVPEELSRLGAALSALQRDFVVLSRVSVTPPIPQE